MAVGWIETSVLTDIANAIRAQNGTASTYTPSEMAAAVAALDGTKAGTAGVEGYLDVDEGVVSEHVFEDIADAIRAQNGSTETYLPSEMAAAILALSWTKLYGLLLSDGTFEVCYRDEAESELGTVAQAFEASGAGYAARVDVPWYSSRTGIERVVFDESCADAGISSIAYWFADCSELREIRGFENLSGLEDISAAFNGCDRLHTIYATSFDKTSLTSGSSAFNGCNALLRANGNSARNAPWSSVFVGGTGVLVDPDNDTRPLLYGHLYDDGQLVVTATAAPDDTRDVVSSGFVSAIAEYISADYTPWWDYRADVTSIAFAEDVGTFPQVRLASAFYATNAVEVTGFSNLAHVKSMEAAFRNCSELVTFSFGDLTPDDVEYPSYAFTDCSSLTTIYGNASWADASYDKLGTFLRCTSLVGGNGTAYSAERTGAEYLRIDAEGSPGYMTLIPAAQPALRALLLDDGTFEVCYRADAESELGTVAQAFEVDPAGYAGFSARPWDAAKGSIERVVIDASCADAGIASTAYWFYGCSNLVEVEGFEHLAGVATMAQMFLSCSSLETIYSDGYSPVAGQAGLGMFAGCARLVGAQGYVPNSVEGVGALGFGEGGVLVDPDADAREWLWGHVYSDGTLEIGASEAADSARTLVGSGRVCAQARYTGLSGVAWHAFADDVTAVSVLSSAAGVAGGTNMDYWFYGLSSLASVTGLANLAGVGEMRYAFANCTSLEELDFGGFDPSALTDLYCCFAGCASLEAIYADADWALPESALGLMTFSGCGALVGGAGSVFDDTRTSYEYLRIDGGIEAPGYLTIA